MTQIKSKYRVGVDIGGTFTDITFMSDKGALYTKKVLSTPDDYSKGILTGINEVLTEYDLPATSVDEVVHASTIVTNACIELAGAKVGLITTKGFRDILELGRGRMPIMYDLSWSKPVPLAPRDLRLEIDERVDAKGEIVTPLNEAEVKTVVSQLIARGCEAIAVCLFNSPKNPAHEQKIGEIIRSMAPQMYVSLSTNVIPLLKEYERTSETVVNAYVMPLVSTYLKALRHNLKEHGIKAPLYIMQSSGGMVSPEIAAERPIEIIECGPAAGVVGAAYLAKQQNIGNLIAFDMGGTTAKASIVEDGQYTRSPEYEIGGGIHIASRLLKGKGYVVRVPSIDIAEIGAGGGSILWVDIGGVLHIGPKSAGAVPGPACYDHGGNQPTLTDANVILGYVNPEYLCGGELRLNKNKAFRAMEGVAHQLSMNITEAAYGAYCMANANMMRAIRAVSSERGRDPRLFALYAFGGAGPTHAVGVAKELDIKTVIIPPAPGVCSALGLLCADIERYYTQTFRNIWDKSVLEKLNNTFKKMTDEAISTAAKWAGATNLKPTIECFVDLRYVKQSSEISIPVKNVPVREGDLTILAESFELEHERTYGHRLPGYAFEVASLRMVARISANRPSLLQAGLQQEEQELQKKISQTARKAYWGKNDGVMDTTVLTLEAVGKKPRKGPIIVDCYDTTVVVPPDCTIHMGDWGNLVININKEKESPND